jgi:hypothetical protein
MIETVERARADVLISSPAAARVALQAELAEARARLDNLEAATSPASIPGFIREHAAALHAIHAAERHLAMLDGKEKRWESPGPKEAETMARRTLASLVRASGRPAVEAVIGRLKANRTAAERTAAKLREDINTWESSHRNGEHGVTLERLAELKSVAAPRLEAAMAEIGRVNGIFSRIDGELAKTLEPAFAALGGREAVAAGMLERLADTAGPIPGAAEARDQLAEAERRAERVTWAGGLLARDRARDVKRARERLRTLQDTHQAALRGEAETTAADALAGSLAAALTILDATREEPAAFPEGASHTVADAVSDGLAGAIRDVGRLLAELESTR